MLLSTRPGLDCLLDSCLLLRCSGRIASAEMEMYLSDLLPPPLWVGLHLRCFHIHHQCLKLPAAQCPYCTTKAAGQLDHYCWSRTSQIEWQSSNQHQAAPWHADTVCVHSTPAQLYHNDKQKHAAHRHGV